MGAVGDSLHHRAMLINLTTLFSSTQAYISFETHFFTVNDPHQDLF